MDRRSFLTLLSTVGVLASAPSWLRDPIMRAKLAPGIELPDDDVSLWLAPRDLAVYGRQETFEIGATHTGDHGIAQVELLRLPEDGGGVMMRFALAPGYFFRWRAAPGEELLGPIKIVSPEFVQTYVMGTDARGRIVYASKDGIVPWAPDAL